MLIIFQNVLIMLIYMICGFAMVKANKTSFEHTKTLSGILIYFCNPCMIISSFLSIENKPENTKIAGEFFLASVFCEVSFVLILYFLLRKKYNNAKYRVMTVGSILGNVGFFGIPLVTGLFPDQPIVACLSIMYVVGMNVLIFTVAVFMITGDKKYMSLKCALLNPTILSAILAFFIYYFKIKLPFFMVNSINTVGKTATPMCMLLLGTRLASMSLREIICEPFAYITCFLKLIVFPLYCYAVVYFIPFFSPTFKITLFILSGTPCASMILSLAEQYGKEQKFSANILILSTICSLITLPFLMLFVKI